MTTNEMPPFCELFVPFSDGSEIEIKGKTLVLEWKSVGRDLVLRPRGAPATCLWFLSNIPVTAARPIPAVRVASLSRRLGLSYGRRDFRRLMPLPGSDWNSAPEKWLLLTSKTSAVACRGHKRGALWRAKMAIEGDKLAFLSAPLALFEEQVMRALENDPLEWQNALEWAQWDDETRAWSLVEWKNGDAALWTRCLRALMTLQMRAGVNQSLKWQLCAPARLPSSVAPPPALTTPIGIFEFRIGMRSQAALAPPLTELLGFLVEFCAPRFDVTRSRFDVARTRLDASGDFFDYLSLDPLKAPAPSHHEILEAMLVWRDFGRHSGRSEAVEAILRQL